MRLHWCNHLHRCNFECCVLVCLIQTCADARLKRWKVEETMKSLQVCWAISLLNGKTDQDLEHHGPRGREVKVKSWRRKDLRHIRRCSMQLHIAPFFCPQTVEGTKAINLFLSTLLHGWQSACGHKFSFDFGYISYYYHCIATPTSSRHSYFRRSTALGQFYLSRTE